jgi:hypothetical protein
MINWEKAARLNVIYDCGFISVVRSTGWLSDRGFCVKCNRMEHMTYEYELEEIDIMQGELVW